ncbi:hypothetical protein VPNG_08879 [Cytospora leucostoma]|uniref:Uncharacterized protein n=1 Tax=Cytospora leucostoma TaxID=1230097 RepID=A0A423VRJ7_9PEZI|nr:hypothetical protein VPNG_08879 [Cytospora leucostoma]
MAVDNTATAALVPARAPYALDEALAAGYAAVLVDILIRAGLRRGDTEGLDMAARESDCQERLGGVDGLREQVRAQREGAKVLKHGEFRVN